MPRDPHRRRRIEGELQRVLSELLRREVRDPRVGSITITTVQVSQDLMHAKVFYTLFGAERDAVAAQAGLQSVAGFLRGQVGRLLKLRVAPEIFFRPDDQFETGIRLTEIIDRAVAQDESRHAGEADRSPPESAADDAPDK